jgi:hypothetical protein
MTAMSGLNTFGAADALRACRPERPSRPASAFCTTGALGLSNSAAGLVHLAWRRGLAQLRAVLRGAARRSPCCCELVELLVELPNLVGDRLHFWRLGGRRRRHGQKHNDPQARQEIRIASSEMLRARLPGIHECTLARPRIRRRQKLMSGSSVRAGGAVMPTDVCSVVDPLSAGLSQ